MSLDAFILNNRHELINRTRTKVAKRPSPHNKQGDTEGGVPVFLSQLASSLRDEAARDPAQRAEADPPTNANIAASATLHGESLRKMGFTIEQVVHDYGDVCQAVTELAVEQNADVTTAEFHTLNRCLDNAIAAAVSSWNTAPDLSLAQGPGRRDVYWRQLLRLVATATVAFDALRRGRVASSGATAMVLGRCLAEIHSLLENPKWAADS